MYLKINFRSVFENMKTKDNKSIKHYSSRFTELVNRMKIYGEDISDKKIVERILIRLPEKVDSKVNVIEETKDISKLTVQELIGSLKSFEQRTMRHSEKSIASVFQSKLNIGPKSNEKQPQNNEQKGEMSNRGGRQSRGRGRNSKGRGRCNFDRRFGQERSS